MADLLSQIWHNDLQETVTVTTKSGPTSLGSRAVQVALLTIYDMCKAVDRGMTITEVRLLEKRGGKSGSWVHD